MRRRELMLLVGGAAVLRPFGGAAQAPAKQYRIAIVQPAMAPADWRKQPFWRAFFPELNRLGDVEGKNLIVESFTAEGHVERYAALARQVADLNPDVIVTLGDMVPALMSATSTIPIAAGLADVAVKQVTNLARPGGNLTGVSPYVDSEFEGKRLALLKEAVPSASRVAAISMQTEGYDVWRSKLREYVGKLGISLIDVVLRDATPQEIERGFAELAQHRPDAMLLSPEVAFIGQARLILRLAEENRLPAMYPYPLYTELGGLMTYTIDPGEIGRQLAEDVHRLLHGAKPGDIPIYQATRFKLTINLKTATTLGLTVPQSLLARADEVIE